MKKDEIKPPSIDEDNEERLPSLPTPMQEESAPVFEPEKVPEVPAEEESKENKAKNTSAQYHNAKLSAPDVAKKYYIPRTGRIASKNICFKKNKPPKPKHGKGSSPRSGSSPFTTDADNDNDKRQLPSRKSRPQQLLDNEQGVDFGDEHLFSQCK